MLNRNLHISNPQVLKLYLLNIHKAGKFMLPMVSSIPSLTYILPKWLTIEINNFRNVQTRFLLTYSLEFIKILKNI